VRSVPAGDVPRMFGFCTIGCIARSRFRGASQAPALRVTSSAHRCGRRTYTSRSRLQSFNRCAARLAPRAERSAWSWTSTLEIRPDLENDEIADWRRRGHRDADARRGARFCPGRWALPHHRDMAPFIPRGMNAADTSAWRGIRIGCVSAPRRGAVRTSPRSWPGTTRRLRRGTNPRFRALARAHDRSSASTRPACA